MAGSYAEDAILTITADTLEAQKQILKLQEQSTKTLQKIEDSFNDMGKKGMGKANDALEKMEAHFSRMWKVGAATIGYIVGSKLVGWFEECVTMSAEAEQAMQSLNVALQTTGIYTDETSKSLEEFSDKLAESSIYEADAIQNSMALLEQIARLDEDGLKKASESAVNLASAFNIDLDTAMKLVGKSVNGNTTALKKLGVEVKAGKTDAESFANTMAALSRFNGVAAEKAKTFEGAMLQLKNQWKEFREEVGSLITQNPVVIAIINELSKAITGLKNNLKENKGGASDFLSKTLLSMVDAAPEMVQSAGNIMGMLSALLGGFSDFVRGVTIAAQTVTAVNPITVLGGAAVGAYSTVLGWLATFNKLIGATFSILPGSIGQASKALYEQMKEAEDELDKFALAASTTSLTQADAVGEIGNTAADGIESASKTLEGAGLEVNKFGYSIQGLGDKVRKGMEQAGKSTAQYGKIAKETDREVEAANKKILYPIENILKATQDLTAENDKRGKSALDLIQIELDGKRELAALTESEARLNLQNQKITQKEYDQAVMITDQYIALAEAKAKADRQAYFKKSPLDFSVQDLGNFNEAINGSIMWAMENAAKAFREMTITDLISGIGTAFSTGADLVLGAMSGAFLTQLTSVVSAIGGAPAAFMSALETLDSTIANLLKDLPSILEKILFKLPAIFSRVLEALPKLVTLLVEKVLPALFSQMAKVLPQLVSTLMDAITKLFEKLPSILAPLMAALPKILKAFLEKLPEALRVALKSLGQIGAQLIAAIPDMIVLLLESIPDITEALIVGLSEGSGEIVVGMIDALLMKGGLERIVKALILFYPRFYRAMYVGMWKAAKEMLPVIGNGIAAAFASAMQNKYVKAIGEKLNIKVDMSWLYQIGPAIAGVGNAIWLNLKNKLIGEGYGIFGGLGATIWNGFKNIADTFNSWLMGIGIQMWNGLISAANAYNQYWLNIGMSIWNGLVTAANASIAYWGSLGASMWNGFYSAMVSGWNNFFNAGQNIGAGLANYLLKIWSWFENMGHNIAVGFTKAMPGNNIGGGVSGGLEKLNNIVSGNYATGGTVPGGFPNDSFNANLTSGEMVIPRSDVDRLSAFLDSAERAKSERPQTSSSGSQGPINVILKVGERELAKILLDLNRAGYRMA